MAISLLVAFLYGSMVFNMLPISELVYSNMSWEGHLAGGIIGLFAAILFRNRGPQKPEEPIEEEPDEEEEISSTLTDSAIQGEKNRISN